jgi:hypothetical protein
VSDRPLLPHHYHHTPEADNYRWSVKEEPKTEAVAAQSVAAAAASALLLPDLSEMFSLDQEDLRLDWPDPDQLTGFSLNTEDLDFADSWLNKEEVFSNMF